MSGEVQPRARGEEVAVFDAELDPITFAVVRNGLLSAAHEMYTVFKRTAMLPLLYEFNDFAMALSDGDLNLLADAPGLPILCGTLETSLKATIDEIGGVDHLAPGDVLFNNHPYMTAGQTADAAVMAPIFFEGVLVGFASLRGHMGDVGAMNLYPSDSTDVYQEGTILPGVKLYNGGELSTEITRILGANSRLPEETVGSILAAAGAVRSSTQKVMALLEKYGIETYRGTIEALLNHGEQATRDAILRIPDGKYEYEELMDGNGLNNTPVRVHCVVEVRGSEMTVDVSGSAEQQEGSINCPWGYTLSACRFALKRLTTPDLPASSGGYRPLSVKAPGGSLFNPSPPAPVFCGIWTALRLSDMVVHALAPAIPDIVPAQHGGDLVVALAYVEDPKTKKVSFFLDLGGLGLGALGHADGTHAVMHPCQAGSESIPAEILETRMPVLKRRCELVTDSGGPGKFRGGVSTIAEFELLGEGVSTIICEKSSAAPVQGLAGGMPAPFNNGIVMFPGTDRERTLGKEAAIPIRRGDRIIVRAAGGGGHGSPLERDPARVASDVKNGYVSVGSARSEYGIVFRSEDEVDEEATSSLRLEVTVRLAGQPAMSTSDR